MDKDAILHQWNDGIRRLNSSADSFINRPQIIVIDEPISVYVRVIDPIRLTGIRAKSGSRCGHIRRGYKTITVSVSSESVEDEINDRVSIRTTKAIARFILD
jgi:hypothetical protein